LTLHMNFVGTRGGQARFSSLPQGYKLPSVVAKCGWDLWWFGLCEGIDGEVSPLRRLWGRSLIVQRDGQKTFQRWVGLYSRMEKYLQYRNLLVENPSRAEASAMFDSCVLMLERLHQESIHKNSPVNVRKVRTLRTENIVVVTLADHLANVGTDKRLEELANDHNELAEAEAEAAGDARIDEEAATQDGPQVTSESQVTVVRPQQAQAPAMDATEAEATRKRKVNAEKSRRYRAKKKRKKEGAAARAAAATAPCQDDDDS